MKIAFALFVVLLFFAFTFSPAYAGQNQAVTRTIQPSDRDSYVDQEKPGENYGTNGVLYLKSFRPKVGDERNRRIYVHFDLSQIPTGSTATASTCSLFMKSAPDPSRNYQAWRATGSWTENGITWNNQPTVAASATATTASGGTSDVWVNWAVTSDVAAFVAGTATNYGWRVKDASEDSAKEYKSEWYSREMGEVETPKLVVTYTAPWDSHKTSYTGPICDTFSDYGTEHTVYMHGTGFKQGTYNVVYWDGGGNKRVTDGSISVGADGILNSQHTFQVGVDVAGTWYASVYVGTTPATHADTTNLWADDSFTVQESAIPEFPDVIAAIAVCMLCAVAYMVMRRKVGKR